MLAKEQILLIIYFIIIILFFVTFGIIFVIAFHKRKNKLLLEKLRAEQRFEDELLKSKIEIQEQTLKNVSWELHDNIGQLLSTAVMQINILGTSIDKNSAESLAEVRELVGSSLQEIRNLSKTLNREVVQNVGIVKSIEVELARFEKLNFLDTKLIIEGDIIHIDPKDEIILYRIVQEFFSNTIKHAEASNMLVSLQYTPESLTIIAKDDGKGYEMDYVQANSGLINMRSRASLVEAEIDFKSSSGKGVELTLVYPFH